MRVNTITNVNYNKMNARLRQNSERSTEIIDAYSALAKTPDSFYSAKNENLFLFDSLLNYNDLTPTIPNIRNKGLEYLNYALVDDSHYAIQAKKDFIKSLFDNGHEITTELMYQFSILKDNYYKSFKEEIIDTCLYSKRYNSMRHDPELGISVAYDLDNDLFSDYRRNRSSENKRCEQLLNNMMLLSTLDKSKYNVYIEHNRNIIQQIKQKLEQLISREGGFYIKDVYQNKIKPI